MQERHRSANAGGWASRANTRRSGIPEVPADAARALREAERRLGASARAAAASAARDQAQISTPPAARPRPQRRASSRSRMPASAQAGGEPSAAPARLLAPASRPPAAEQRQRAPPRQAESASPRLRTFWSRPAPAALPKSAQASAPKEARALPPDRGSLRKRWSLRVLVPRSAASLLSRSPPTSGSSPFPISPPRSHRGLAVQPLSAAAREASAVRSCGPPA